MPENHEDIIIGRNAVAEALKAERPINTLFVLKDASGAQIARLVAGAKAAGAVVKYADRKKLDSICSSTAHQGVAAFAAAHGYAGVEDILALAGKRNEKPFIIICDGIEDPHNLGAIIRTAEAGGAHGVIIPKRRSVPLNATVGKASAGAVEHLPVARVTNLAAAVDSLKEKGLWVYCADMDGGSWCECDYSGAVALVVGSEGKGVSRIIKEKCDFTVSLPMRGKVNSLNASVAAGIIIYEIARQRTCPGKGVK